MLLMIIFFLVLAGLTFKSLFVFLSGAIGLFTYIWPIQSITLISVISILYFKLKDKLP